MSLSQTNPVTHPVEAVLEERKHWALALVVLTLGTLLSVVLASSDWIGIEAVPTDPNFIRLMHGMGAIKGLLTLIAFAICAWRLQVLPSSWRTVAYVGGIWLMAAGTILIWRMQHLGIANVVLHTALFGLVALALSDRDFFAPMRRAQR